MDNEINAYKNLSIAINNMSFSKKAFVDAFTKDHRYLQGEVFQLALAIIEKCASDDYAYDGRNEFCHIIAKEIVSKVPKYF